MFPPCAQEPISRMVS